MEELAGQQEKIENPLKGGHNGSKEDWKNECSLSSFLKQSCLLCWSSPRDTDIAETDERVLAKAAEIRELEKALSVENIELQEQQTDCKELEETLVKLEKHKDKLIQQLKTTRQLCYEESQQILSLQAEEVKKESQAEEYERELDRARWRLRKLREEVKQAKRKVEEAGERNMPLQDSIRQSYEEILQEEHILSCLSGGAVTPESQLEESTSPANTTEDEPFPIRPWGRSQSLPAYVDLIMMNKQHIEDDPEERNISNKGETDKAKKGCTINPNSLSYLDFYQEDPFSHCQSDHYLFNEDLFSNTDLSDGFTSDPFKGSNPFSAEYFFPDVNTNTDKWTGKVCDKANTNLSFAENKASTGTQCFDSEFPDEDSDIEISYSPDELEAMTVVDDSLGFKPIQSSSEELGLDAIQGWRTHGQYSEESDPNGYELDLGTISPPPDTQEQSLGSLAGQATTEQTTEQEEGSVSAQMVAELKKELETVQTDTEQTISGVVSATQTDQCVNNITRDLQNPATSQNSLDFHNRSDPNKKLNFRLSYVPSNQTYFDPYGFKLSPEHVSHTLLDPDEVLLGPEPTEIDTFKFKIITSKNIQCFDPYGFKLSPEEENQEILRLCEHDNQEAMDLLSYDSNDQKDSSNYSTQEILEPQNNKKEALEYCSPTHHELLDLYHHGNCEVLESTSLVNLELNSNENSQVLVISHDSSVELLEHCNCNNQEMLGHTGKKDFMQKDDEEILVSGSHDNQELMPVGGNENQDLLELGSHDLQVVLNKKVSTETNNNKCTVKPQPDVRPKRDSSDCNVASEDRLVPEFNSCICSTSATNISIPISNISTTKDLATFNSSAGQSFIESDLGSVFEAGRYIGCPDVADDIESLTQMNSVPDPVKPFKPIRPPRPSLRAQERDYTQAQGIDLK